MTGHRRALLLGLLLTFSAANAQPKWPHEQSDLQPDPAVQWGVLTNGFRYAIRPNAEPKGRISMRFIVQAGSMHESDDERGLAHFVEHMAFRSTEDHPEGSLMANLQRMGIAFGPDNTAFTTYDYTIYHLELPDTKPETLREGLNVFREYAQGITFSEQEVNLERGVVLSEMSTRNVPDLRTALAYQAFVLPYARLNTRSPIGLEDQIRKFTPAQFRAFYDAWYRPERMILSVVGEVDPAVAAQLIQTIFEPLTARAPARPEPSLTLEKPVTDPALNATVFKDPDIIGMVLQMAHAEPAPTDTESLAQWTSDLQASLGFHMLYKRFQRMAQRRGTSFISPSVNFSGNLNGWRINTLSLPSKLLAWRLVTSEADQELRRALDYGFTSAELRDAKVYYKTQYEQGVRSAATTPSDNIATGLAVAINYDRVFSSAEFIADQMLPRVEAATLEDCNRAFRDAWGQQPPKVFIGANSALKITLANVVAAYDYSRRIEILPPVDRSEVEFAYTDFGPTGKLMATNHVDDLDVQLSQFDNGVNFNFKQTDFEEDTVLVNLRVGDGRLSMPLNEPGLDQLANHGLLVGGVGRHTNNEMSDILNGHVIGLNFGVGSDAFNFSLRCAPRELLLGLQTLTALLTDSAYRPEAVRAARAGFGSIYESLATSPGGPIFQNAPRVLASDDARFGVPAMETLSSRTLDELRAWLEPQFQHGPIEVSMVGDVDLATATEAMAKTLGALPQRESRPATEKLVEVKPPAQPGAPMTWTVNPALRQVAVAFYWPIASDPDVFTERRYRLLTNIIEERLRQRVREELGASYVVSCRMIYNEGFRGQNFIEIYAAVEPKRAPEVEKLIQREITAMRREGFTSDEFTRSKQPYVTQRLIDLRQNSYWAYTVLRDAQQRPDRLISARNRTEDNSAITQAEVQTLLDQDINPAAAFTFRTVPYQN